MLFDSQVYSYTYAHRGPHRHTPERTQLSSIQIYMPYSVQVTCKYLMRAVIAAMLLQPLLRVALI